MSYLIQSDYNKQIQADNLNQVIGSDLSVLSSAELAAQEEITSYLIQKYDLTKEFTDTKPWSNAVAYKAGDRVSDSNILYFGAYPKPIFDYTLIYAKGDQVFYKDKTYTAQLPTVIPSHETQLQYDLSSVPRGTSVFPDDPILGAQYWGTGTSYTITAGTVLTDAKWTKGDNRSQQMVQYMVDIALFHVHSRISPRNIPEIRFERYTRAISWLKSAGKGDITANLPVKQVHTGGRIRYGGQVKNINKY
jgi:hypothetical protein